MGVSARVAAAGDVDADGMREALISNRPFTIATLNADNIQTTTQAPGYVQYADDMLAHASIADANGDGRLDYILSSDDGLSAINYSLSSVDHYPAPYSLRYALSANLNTSGGDAIFGVSTDRIWQFTTGARQADGFPVPLPHNADVALFPSSEGRLSIAAAAPDGSVYLFTTGTSVSEDQLIWRSRNGNERNNYSVSGSFVAPPPIEDFFPEERCYNWPNPVYDDVTYIRLYVSEDANVSIKIYDLAGDSVDEINAKVVGGTDNDIPWNVADIQSDVYIARIEATAPGKSGEKIIKIAVVK